MPAQSEITDLPMTDSPDQPLAARLADALGRDYTIEGEIGRGGMGVVYRARDEKLQRRVAIKVLPPELAYQPEIRERFLREAQTAARLSHPHIVAIHAVGEAAGLVYFVMGYVDGESVAARIRRRGPLPPDEVRRVMKETADALSAAHAVGIVHRDIKPDNILLEGNRGRVMVTDFGIAKALSAASGQTLTGAGVAIGTPSFMSPEQAAGEKEIDGRSDIYSLGIVSFQMLSGQLPFTAPTVAGILMKQITEPAPDIRALRPDVPEDLGLAIARCLEKDPENRWPTADALRRALESHSVGGYRPTGTGWKAAPRTASAEPMSPRPLAGAGLAPRAPRSPMPAGQAPRPAAARGQWYRNERGEWVRRQERADPLPGRDTGEPEIVLRVRGQFATWLAVNGGLFLLNVATTQLDPPWFLFPAAGMGIGLFRNYAKLWQDGYSWRDVLRRPPAADSVERQLARGGRPLLDAPKAEELGAWQEAVQQVYGDRQAILRIVERLPESERKLLPEVGETVDGLYNRALDLGRTLHLMAGEMDEQELPAIDRKLEAVRAEPEGEDRDRRLSLLERQRKSVADLLQRRAQVQAHLDNCVLAMQNLRLDLLKLKSANVAEVMGDITQATQQARALSRNVDNAIAAAGEIREAIGK